MEKRFTSILVGMHFRPPAKVVLAHLPSGCNLELVPEPTNEWDEFAIKVMVGPDEVPAAELGELAEEMANHGKDLHEFLEGGQFQLGYIASSPGKKGPMHGITYAPQLQPDLVAAADYKATLGFDPTGGPIVTTVLMEDDDEQQ